MGVQCFGFQLRSNLQTKKKQGLQSECDAVRTVDAQIRLTEAKREEGADLFISHCEELKILGRVRGRIEFKVYSYKRNPKKN